MKIIKLEVEGYRSLKSQTWCPGDLNVLIGPNASGKSDLPRVLEMLSTAAQGCAGGPNMNGHDSANAGHEFRRRPGPFGPPGHSFPRASSRSASTTRRQSMTRSIA